MRHSVQAPDGSVHEPAGEPFAAACSDAPLALAGLRRNTIRIGAGFSIRHVSVDCRADQRKR